MEVGKEEFRLRKTLKVFSLVTLALVLGAGVLWAFDTLVLSGNNDVTVDLAAGATSTGIITGNGTQRGGVDLVVAVDKILRLNAADGNVVTLAPGGAGIPGGPYRLAAVTAGAAANIQVVVNDADAPGKVVMKASNGDNPGDAGGANMTEYSGGTVLESGTLGVTRGNALGQAWVAVLGNVNEASAPVFQTEGVNEVQLGKNDPTGAATVQPFYLLWAADPPAANTDLRYVEVNVPQTSASNNGLMLRHGLDQRDYTAPTYVVGAGADTLAGFAAAGANTYVRLVKTGDGRLWVNGGEPGLAPNGGSTAPVDGVHHFGGTVVRDGGLLEVIGGVSAVVGDHFRGSLGKVWNTFEGSTSAPGAVANTPRQYVAMAIGGVAAGGAIYNPLHVQDTARVKVDRSQFFSDFNVAGGATFQANEYTLAGTNYKPQIAVTLDRRYSHADGLLKGQFDLVLNSLPSPARPTGDPQDPNITDDGQTVLFVSNLSNDIVGETLVANGVLEIAGNESIGNGNVTVGATGGADRDFTTANLATLTASKTLKVSGDTFTKDGGGSGAALAAERGQTLSFRDITLDNGRLTINPADVPTTNGLPLAGNLMPKNWQGTVLFGAPVSTDAVYRAAGVMINPSDVFVDRGVLQLNSFPVRTAAQQAANEDPFMDVTLVDGATLSLGKDVNDFKPYMDLTINNDSRIRMVLRNDDIAATRAEAMAKPAVFEAREIDYTAIGYGEVNRDRRLAIQLDPSHLTGDKIKKGWIKLVYSPDAVNWNALHFLRENSTVEYEDYAKVRITWTTTSDIVKNAVAHLDENSYTILVEVGQDIVDPVNPGTPPVPTPDLTGVVTAPSQVQLGANVTFELGKWTYKTSDDVEVQDVVWTLDGVDKTADVAAGKLTVKAENEGTMNLVVTAKLKADPTVNGEAKASVIVSKNAGGSSGGGGCNLGFAPAALLLLAPLGFLKK